MNDWWKFSAKMKFWREICHFTMFDWLERSRDKKHMVDLFQQGKGGDYINNEILFFSLWNCCSHFLFTYYHLSLSLFWFSIFKQQKLIIY